MEQKSSISKQSECKHRVCNYLQYVCDMHKFSSVEVTGFLTTPRGGERSGRIRFESRPPRPQSDVNSREDALEAYRRTRLKLLAWVLSDEYGI